MVGTLAADLFVAEQRTRALPLPRYAMALHDAYQVQEDGLRLRLKAGGTQVGYKIGLTSRAAQQSRRVGHPVAGYLLDSNLTELDRVNLDHLIAPRVEIELAVVLGRQLGAGSCPDDALNATAELALALEVVDSRWQHPPTRAGLLVADNVSGSGAVLGRRFAVRSAQMSPVRVEAELDDQPLGDPDGSGATTTVAAVGSSVAWLASHLGGRGKSIRRGDIVLSGAIVPPISVRAGQVLTANYAGLGTLSVSFC